MLYLWLTVYSTFHQMRSQTGSVASGCTTSSSFSSSLVRSQAVSSSIQVRDEIFTFWMKKDSDYLEQNNNWSAAIKVMLENYMLILKVCHDIILYVSSIWSTRPKYNVTVASRSFHQIKNLISDFRNKHLHLPALTISISA